MNVFQIEYLCMFWHVKTVNITNAISNVYKNICSQSVEHGAVSKCERDNASVFHFNSVCSICYAFEIEQSRPYYYRILYTEYRMSEAQKT